MRYAANLSTLPIAQDADDFDAQCDKRRIEELVVQVVLLQDIFGPLLFRPIRFDPASLAWKGGMIYCIAQGIYNDRTFDQLPIVADALEEAGCQEQSILDHLRSPGPHVRGCWPLDLILGRA
jgi:hypothetical protein